MVDSNESWKPPGYSKDQEIAFKTINSWVENSDKPPIYFLKGLKWTGKTTMARWFVEKFHNDRKLVASFFCCWANTDLLFLRLAIQLARKIPRFRSNFVEVIRSDPSIIDQKLDDQIGKLILNPLKKSGLPKMVIVIEDLEEYRDKGKEILTCLEKAESEIKKAKVKFIITFHPTLSIPEKLISNSVSKSYILEEVMYTARGINVSTRYISPISHLFQILFYSQIINCIEPI